MASFARAARLLTLLQVALLVVSAVLMSGSAVCHGARNAGELSSISQIAPLIVSYLFLKKKKTLLLAD
jgi:hypothetical protein